jgi:antagonist of KipI
VIVVESPGLLTTVQDLGRPGYGAIGVSPSGAADPVSLRIANLLVGNPPGAAALEMTMTGGRFRFTEDTAIATCGAGPSPAAAFQPANSVLRIGPMQAGARVYLAVRGGIEVPLILGSASTHLLSALGGHEGRALRKGDTLRTGAAAGDFRARETRPETLARLAHRKTLRITRAAQSNWFSEEARARFAAAPFRVTQNVDRMGLRLAGRRVQIERAHDMITEGVALGAIQIPSDGQPILLFVEQQTTGGYPKIANVVSADLASAGQLRPGDEVRFEWVSFTEARALFIEQERLLTPEELFA